VRITAQLIEATRDQHLWAHSYDGDARDILALQSDVAQSIAAEVSVHLTPQERVRLSGRGSVDPKAYDAYLRGRFFWNKRTVPDIQRGITFFNEAIAADPTWAPAHAGLADSYNILGDQHTMAPAEVAIYARAAAERALELDPQLAEAHTSLGYVLMFYDWDAAAAERAFQRELSLNPSYATGRQWYSEYLCAQGRFDEAIVEATRAHQLDPLSSVIGTTLGDTLYFSRRYDEAIAELNVIVSLWPEFLHATHDLGRALTECGRFDEAIEAFHTAARQGGGDPRSSAGLGRAYALAGREREAREVLQVLEQAATHRYVSAFAVATIHAALGEPDPAFDHLERAFAMRDTALVWAKVHPRIDPLRSDPRFDALMRRMWPA
jgi:tetratricopeptide (TPR) repeat protein